MSKCVITGLGLLASAACAPATSSRTEQLQEAVPQGPRWTGNLQPTQQRSGALTVTGQNRAFGTVVAEMIPARAGWMKVRVAVALPSSNGSVGWAMLADRCGTHGLPLIGYEQFPMMDIGANGRGEVTAELPLPLTAGSAYHVNIYARGGHQLDNVVTCANLRFQPATMPAE